jgi:hypothetical protein
MAFTLRYYRVTGTAYRSSGENPTPIAIDRTVAGSTPEIATQNALDLAGCIGWLHEAPVCELVDAIPFSDQEIEMISFQQQKTNG